ncbi:MAG TPA: hypothetical protein VK146_02970, partial [Tabrizicola sp.]|nr:hypothetical protein [Tabrizicola sp.]
FVLVLPVTLVGGAVISVVAETQGVLAALACFVVVIVVLFAVAYRTVLSGEERAKLVGAVRRLSGRGG